MTIARPVVAPVPAARPAAPTPRAKTPSPQPPSAKRIANDSRFSAILQAPTVGQAASPQPTLDTSRIQESSVSSASPPIKPAEKKATSDTHRYFAEKANTIPGFRMLTMVLGVNPIDMSPVDRSAANILRAVVEFMPGGGLITQALEKYGLFDRVAGWIDEQLRSLGMDSSVISEALERFLDSLGLSDLFNLGGVWERAKRIFSAPIELVVEFVRGLAAPVVGFIKDAILGPLGALAAQTPGWDLLKAVLGYDPITGEAVPRNAETLIGGFMKLIGQEEIWENIKKANAIPRAFAWFEGALSGLLGFVQQIPGRFLQELSALEIADMVLLPQAFAKVGKAFGGFFAQFVSWAGDATWNLLEIIFSVVAPGVMVYLRKASSAFRTILKNPGGFVGNLVRAGKLGLQQFAGNFAQHLRASLIGWLTGALSGAGLYIPQALTLTEIGKFVLSVLGVTWPKIRARFVRVIGEPAMKALETGFDMVVALAKGGPAAAWEVIKEQLANLHDMVQGSIIDFVKERVVQAAITKLVSMLSPVGAFIQAIIAIYNTVMFFVERLRQIAQVATAFIDSISAIADGIIAAAANRVEQTMGGLLTLVISFLARLAGLGKVSDAVVKLVGAVQARVEGALDAAVRWIVARAKRLGRIVVQVGVPQDPNERLRAAMQAALSIARLMSGPITVGVLEHALAAIKLRYALQDLRVFSRNEALWIRMRINPVREENSGKKEDNDKKQPDDKPQEKKRRMDLSKRDVLEMWRQQTSSMLRDINDLWKNQNVQYALGVQPIMKAQLEAAHKDINTAWDACQSEYSELPKTPPNAKLDALREQYESVRGRARWGIAILNPLAVKAEKLMSARSTTNHLIKKSINETWKKNSFQDKLNAMQENDKLSLTRRRNTILQEFESCDKEYNNVFKTPSNLNPRRARIAQRRGTENVAKNDAPSNLSLETLTVRFIRLRDTARSLDTELKEIDDPKNFKIALRNEINKLYKQAAQNMEALGNMANRELSEFFEDVRARTATNQSETKTTAELREDLNMVLRLNDAIEIANDAIEQINDARDEDLESVDDAIKGIKTVQRETTREGREEAEKGDGTSEFAAAFEAMYGEPVKGKWHGKKCHVNAIKLTKHIATLEAAKKHIANPAKLHEIEQAIEMAKERKGHLEEGATLWKKSPFFDLAPF